MVGGARIPSRVLELVVALEENLHCIVPSKWLLVYDTHSYPSWIPEQSHEIEQKQLLGYHDAAKSMS